MSLRGEITRALAERLATITVANGYPETINALFWNKMPLGMELQPHELPAIFLIDQGGPVRHQHGAVMVRRSFRIQLVHGQVSDEVMGDLIRSVAKAIFANSATVETTGEFRFHPKVHQVEIDTDETDLHLIEANRIGTLSIGVSYQTKPYDL